MREIDLKEIFQNIFCVLFFIFIIGVFLAPAICHSYKSDKEMKRTIERSA